jgi:hypothetical protein
MTLLPSIALLPYSTALDACAAAVHAAHATAAHPSCRTLPSWRLAGVAAAAAVLRAQLRHQLRRLLLLLLAAASGA